MPIFGLHMVLGKTLFFWHINTINFVSIWVRKNLLALSFFIDLLAAILHQVFIEEEKRWLEKNGI